MLRTIKNFANLGDENAFAVLARANQLASEGRDIINLGIGQPDFKTPDHIVKAAVDALEAGEHGYTPANGIPRLREVVADELNRRHGADISPDSVMIMPGGKVTMYMAITLFGESGADILYPDPGFPIYRSMIEFTGARPIPVPLREENGFAFSAEELLSLITPQTRLIILNSPSNPTGGVTPKEEIDKLVKGLEAWPDAAILSDEIYSRMTFDGLEHQSLTSYPEIKDRLILLNGWSKTYAMTGWRLGFSVWPEALYDDVRKLAVNSYSCVNSAAQFAGIAAITGPQDAADDMMAEFDRRRKAVVTALNDLPNTSCAIPKGAFYAFPNISQTGFKAKDLSSRLLEEAGVATIGGPDFGVYGEGYIRLSYANSLENILKAVERIGDFLKANSA
ncbi:Aspartate/methionine/tyrosine aminotransferase [Cohaesibacter sp. ES.047]|uniref:pyridoxal phosphate-dependent aminotransferase n=1 Tax=Cohaesibacter sp. ES.047 TaxID=1798205 RepID=UPI000BB70B90|nr:pyridoxal phosphate-dependent aminotransferase [Cohaesibacter sp. ES.047]SNY90912.1 Aspartate/methionine/tyrosine aminotransferase [Cohaesibacter sp. ES.047]